MVTIAQQTPPHRLELEQQHSDPLVAAEHHLEQEDEEQKDADGAGTVQGLPQHAGFIDELEQLEHPQAQPNLNTHSSSSLRTCGTKKTDCRGVCSVKLNR